MIERDGWVALVGSSRDAGCPLATSMLTGVKLQTAGEIAWLKASMALKKGRLLSHFIRSLKNVKEKKPGEC